MTPRTPKTPRFRTSRDLAALKPQVEVMYALDEVRQANCLANQQELIVC